MFGSVEKSQIGQGLVSINVPNSLTDVRGWYHGTPEEATTDSFSEGWRWLQRGAEVCNGSSREQKFLSRKVMGILGGASLSGWRGRASPRGSAVENCLQCKSYRRCGFDPWVGKILWRRAWQPTPVFLPGESHGQKSLAGYSP